MEKLKAITQAEIQPTLHVGRNDSPELGVNGMQALFDAHPNLNSRTANENMEIQNRNNSDMETALNESVRSTRIKRIQTNTDNVIEVSEDGTNYYATASSGHIVLDRNGTQMPQRARMQFAHTETTDINGVTVVQGVTGPQGVQGAQGRQGEQGAQGLIGKVYLPVMTDDGDILWQLVNDSGTTPPQRNIRGPQGIQGAQGTQGMQGSQGIQGAQGSQGIQGPQGSQGADGAAGMDGRSFTVHGRYNTLLDLQTDYPVGQDGDAWAVGSISNNNVYVWDITDNIWRNIGPIQGPMGPQGAQGEPGAQGVQGEQGISGANGAQGIQGIQGERGIQGVQGERGVQGLPTMVNGKTGESIVLNSSDVGATPAGTAAPAGFGLGTTCISVADWNTVTKNGFYMGSGANNAPAADWYYGVVISHNVNWVTQILIDFTNRNKFWVRQCRAVGDGGAVWSAWQTMSDTYMATIGTAASQNIGVAGILATDNPMIDVVLSGNAATDLARLEAWGSVSRIVTYNGGITVICYEQAPSVAIPIQIKVVR